RPEDADEGLEADMSAIDYLAPSLDDVKGYFERFGVASGVEFVPGFFEQTLEQLRGRCWALVRLDADGYNATRLAVDVLYRGLSVGGYLIIDDYFHPHLRICRDAVNGFREEHGLDETIERIDWVGARWQKLRELAPAADPVPTAAPEAPRAAVERTG